MGSRNERHVSPHPRGGWQVTHPGVRRAVARTETQADGADRVRAPLRADGGEPVIHGRNGRIRDWDTIAPGNDPLPTGGQAVGAIMDGSGSALTGLPGPSASCLQVLALDGGGLRGIFTAATLAAWEEDFGTPVSDHFDLIVGTSTGGIIAVALGLGVRPAEVLSIYVDHGDRIFPRAGRARRGLFRRFLRPRYGAVELRAVLRDRFGDRVLGDSRARLAIPAYDLAADHVHLFRTPHHPDLRRDWRVSAVDVALATAAAPTFLPAHRMEAHRLIDGGVWANNPALVGAAECFDRLGGERGRIRVLSVGTTSEVRERRTALDKGGLARMARGCSRRDAAGSVPGGHQPCPAHPRADQRRAGGRVHSRGPSQT